MFVKKIQKVLSLLVVFSIALSISGCSNSNEESVEKKTITIYSYGTTPKKEELWGQAKQEFESQHPGVTVKYVYYYSDANQPFTEGNYQDELDNMMSDNQSPDIVMGIPLTFTELDDQGYLHDLNFLANRINLTDYFHQPLLDNFVQNGKQLAIPLRIIPLVVMYNKSVLQQIGEAEPAKNWTWDDFVRIASKLKNAKDGTAATLLPLNYSIMEMISISKGGSFMSPDGSTFKGHLDGKETVAAISWYSNWVDEGVFNPDPDIGQGLKSLEAGRAGMLISNHSHTRFITPDNKDQIGLSVLPSFPGMKKSIWGSLIGAGVMQNSAHPELAFELLRFVAMEKNDISEAMNPINQGLSNKITGAFMKDPYYQVVIESMPFVKKGMKDINVNALNVHKQLENGLEKIVFQNANSQQSLSELAESLDDKMEALNKK